MRNTKRIPKRYAKCWQCWFDTTYKPPETQTPRSESPPCDADWPDKEHTQAIHNLNTIVHTQVPKCFLCVCVSVWVTPWVPFLLSSCSPSALSCLFPCAPIAWGDSLCVLVLYVKKIPELPYISVQSNMGSIFGFRPSKMCGTVVFVSERLGNSLHLLDQVLDHNDYIKIENEGRQANATSAQNTIIFIRQVQLGLKPSIHICLQEVLEAMPLQTIIWRVVMENLVRYVHDAGIPSPFSRILVNFRIFFKPIDSQPDVAKCDIPAFLVIMKFLLPCKVIRKLHLIIVHFVRQCHMPIRNR